MISNSKKSVIPLLLSLFWILNSQTQSLELPSFEALQTTLTTFTELERDSKLKALETRQNGSWQDLLPSLGVAYTPTGAPRPAASWSPLQILDRKDRKRQQKQDRQSIIFTYELILTDRIYKLQQLYHDYMIDLQILKSKQQSIEIDETLFDITQSKYDNNIIKPSEYLQAKKQILAIRSALQIEEQELLKAKNEIFYYAKYN
ncbi:MAG: TolC family protein [Saprospiraceae bacterium]|nr:TolC family protein [Saprospiraceae bacterium]